MKIWLYIVGALLVGFGLGFPTGRLTAPVFYPTPDTTGHTTIVIPGDSVSLVNVIPKPHKPKPQHTTAMVDTEVVYITPWLPSVQEVTLDTTKNGVSFGIVYALPTPDYPLGVFTDIDIGYPIRIDTVQIVVPFPVEGDCSGMISTWIAAAAVVGAILIGFFLGGL